MGLEYLDKDNPDGTSFGQDTSALISFYGVTAVDQPADANQEVMTTTLTQIASDAALTLAVQAINATNTLLLQLRSDLVALGLIKGSA